jgi:hypothetical protein
MIKHDEFKSRALKVDAIEKINKTRQLFDDFLTELEALLPAGRYLSIVKTHLETASFFVHKGISSEIENIAEISDVNS